MRCWVRCKCRRVLVWYRCGCGCQHRTSPVQARLFGAPCSGGLRRSPAMGLQRHVLGGCFSLGSFWGRRRSGRSRWHRLGLGMPSDPCCWGHVGHCWNCDYAMVNLVKPYITLYEEDKKEEASMQRSLFHGSWDQILQRRPVVSMSKHRRNQQIIFKFGVHVCLGVP